MKFNRSDLLTQVRKGGYTGEADPAKVKSFLAGLGMDSENIEVPGDDGKPTSAKFDDVWAKTATLALPAQELDAATAEGDAPEVETKEAPKPRAKVSPLFARSGLASQLTVVTRDSDAGFKRYDARIKATQAGALRGKDAAVFDDVETAEAYSAWMRKTIAEQANHDYSRYGSDQDILKKFWTKTGVGYTNTAGGATVPQAFVPSLIWRTEAYGAARQLANVVRMSRDNQVFPRKTAIVSMSFTQEGSTPSTQDNSYDNVELTARKAMALVQVSNEWLEDSAVNVADDYGNTFAEAQAYTEDNTYFNGDGTATYGGFRGLANALPSGASIGSNTAWGSLTLANFNNLMGSVQNVNNGRLQFVGSRQFYHQVCVRLDKQATQYKDTGGNPANGFGSGLQIGTFLGYPFIFSQLMPTSTAATKCVYFGDFAGASMLGDRRDFRVDVSKDYYFGADCMALRATSRIAINVHGDGRGSTVGPIACQVGA